jgi:hypothetical protein
MRLEEFSVRAALRVIGGKWMPSSSNLPDFSSNRNLNNMSLDIIPIIGIQVDQTCHGDNEKTD